MGVVVRLVAVDGRWFEGLVGDVRPRLVALTSRTLGCSTMILPPTA
jgi:hypothetical protein